MIGRLTGRYAPVDQTQALIDVGGVGYLVQASAKALSRWDASRDGPPVTVLVETVLREDALLLYGFADEAERGWFRLLTQVQGVGARVALNLLSVLDPPALATALAAGDQKALTRADNVGPKLAARLVAELKDKVATLPVVLRPSLSTGAGPMPQPGGSDATASPLMADALSGLLNLGFDRVRAEASLTRLLAGDPDLTLDRLIRLALQDLAR